MLTEFASWRWCLGVNVPVALLVAALAVPLVKESKAHGDTRYDVPGVLLATTGLFALVFGFTEAAKAKNPNDPADTAVQGWGDPSTLTWLVVRRRAADRVRAGGSAARPTRCCRCGSCCTATAARRT